MAITLNPRLYPRLFLRLLLVFTPIHTHSHGRNSTDLTVNKSVVNTIGESSLIGWSSRLLTKSGYSTARMGGWPCTLSQPSPIGVVSASRPRARIAQYGDRLAACGRFLQITHQDKTRNHRM